MDTNDLDRPDVYALVRRAHAERARYLGGLLAAAVAAIARGMTRATAPVRTAGARGPLAPR